MIGSVLAGRFEINALVSEGPIFTLLRARDRITGRDASLRLIRPPYDGQAEFIDALTAAIAKVSPIVHSNVERLFELDRHDGHAYIVGEWTQAPALADRIRKLAPFSVPVAVAAAVSVCRGLDAFHKLGIVHGDVGPDTSCLMADGEVRLQMGGLWEAYSASPTAGAVVLPSLAPSLAPEVGKGAMPSLRSDVYAVGVLLFELLTGRKPYVGDTPLATAMRHSTDETPRVRAFNPSVPVVLDEIVAKAMAKDPAERYASAAEMAADLRLVQDALRFGRTLTWPLRPGQAAAAPAKTVAGSRVAREAKPGRAAPRMSAIKEEEKEEEYGRIERDVPAWAALGLALVACVAVSLLAVYFVLNLNRPHLVTVPNLHGLSMTDAQSSLNRLKLNIRSGDHVPNPQVETDHVIDTEPAAGTRVREDTTLVARLSSGSSQVAVPDLTGMTPDKARSVLETIGLELDSETDKVNKSGAAEGTVVAQKPKPSTQVARNGKVKVTIQDASLPSPESQRFEYTLDVNLVDLTQRTRVKVEMEDLDGVHELQSRRRSPGETFNVKTVARGDHATFRIYYDETLVKTIVQRSDGSKTETMP